MRMHLQKWRRKKEDVAPARVNGGAHQSEGKEGQAALVGDAASVQPNMSKAQLPDLPRPEFPRPDWVREGKAWENLNGKWKFAFDDQDNGLIDGWWKWTGADDERQPFDRE